MNGIEVLRGFLPDWAVYIYLGIIIMIYICATGTILARLGIKPLWALLVFIPITQIAGFWLLAYRKWPREKMAVVIPPPASGGTVG